MTNSALLSDRSVLAVSGEDAGTFLQGLITNDIRNVTQTRAVFAALLSPQGRFLFDFFIIAHEGKLLLETDKARLPELKKRLQMYKLRANVTFEEMPQMQVAAVWDGKSTAEGQIRYDDPRLPELGMRIIGTGINIQGAPEDYDRHRLSLGVPEGAKDLIIDRSILLEYGYDELHAIDFQKGCYVGQEVTARSKHRAALHKFIHTVKADIQLPPAGTPVMAADREVGQMRSSNGNIGLALLRVEASGSALASNGIALSASLPHWCATSFAETK